jgi:hypothetical protein
MRLFDFLDILYQKLSLQLARDYSIAKDAECKAIHMLIGWQRFFFKWLAVPKLIGHWMLVKLHIIKAPASPLNRPLAQGPRAVPAAPVAAPAPQDPPSTP